MKFRISYKTCGSSPTLSTGINTSFERWIISMFKRFGYNQYASGFNFTTSMRDIAFDNESKHKHCIACGRNIPS